MTLGKINVEESIKKLKELMEKEKLSPAMRVTLETILLLIQLLIDRLGLNSTNSSIPPSADPNRVKETQEKNGKKPGGQKGRTGKRLEKVTNPDEVRTIAVNLNTIPKGKYREIGYETRQVFEIIISRNVIEYRAQILVDKNGKEYRAPFPEGVEQQTQYGNTVKAQAVYLSQYQLIPYNRMEEYFSDQLNLPLSAGTIHNFNKKTYDLLETFETKLKKELIKSTILHADETGININGRRKWLHSNSNEKWTYFFPHSKRGKEAMDEMGVLPYFKGTLIHDHWKPYFRYKEITHALCNSHHFRELDAAYELDGQQWAKEMKKLLIEIKQATENAAGELAPAESEIWRVKYQTLLKTAEEECPPPADPPPEEKKKGRQKRSKSRNLLERFLNFEDDVLRFMEDKDVPFTNNLGERDIRMTKLHQKISGCFRSEEGAKMFCRIRSYISSARKQGFTASYALKSLFDGRNIFEG